MSQKCRKQRVRNDGRRGKRAPRRVPKRYADPSPVRFTEFSIRNALVVAAVTMALAFLGLYAYGSMGVGITPNVSFPLVLVTTTDPGADPATIESQITKPIEDAVAALPNVDTITSTSSDGVSSVAIQFTTAANSELAPVC